MLEIVQIPVLEDNYLYLIHDPVSGDTAIVDPAVEDEVVAELSARSWQLTHIFNTHHHLDHTGANLALKARYGATVVGAAIDRERIPGIDIAVGEGNQVHLGTVAADVYFVPGHTSGHIAYHFPTAKALFSGDALFSMGCGRTFEGTHAQMWQSLTTLMALPDDTLNHCAHEYTAANGAFALTLEPNNIALIERMKAVKQLRRDNKPTVPSTLGLEKQTNPFLRPMSGEIQDTLGMVGDPLPAIFSKTRTLKDTF
ncbi:MAG: hydroxyacylglutathione hydrolase [Kordiimonadaceae bacterium]|nr:hydroxyacylglutathione hydrolase [Kordiimonadaceae bacterium]